MSRPPNPIEAAERAVVAALVAGGPVAEVAEAVTAEDFSPAWRRVFEACRDLHREGVTVDALSAGERAKVPAQELYALSREVMAPGNASHYAARLRDLRDRAAAVKALKKAARDVETGGDLGGALEGLQALRQAPRPAPAGPRTVTAAALRRMTFAEPRWAVPGLLPEGLTLLGGRPKMGKSWLTLDLAVAVACGGAALGRWRVEAGAVLLLALEDNPRRLQERIGVVLDGSAAPESLEVATEWPRGAAGLAALEAWLSDHPTTRLVVIDTLGRFRAPARTNGNQYADDTDELGRLQSMAVRRGVAVLAVHHLRKTEGGEDPFDQLTGSTGLTGAADAIILLSRQRGDADAFLRVTGRDVPDAEHGLRWDPARCCWHVVGDAAELKMSAERRAILDALKGAPGGLAPNAVAKAAGLKPDSVRHLLRRMATDGIVVSAGGQYTAAANWSPSGSGQEEADL